MGLKEALLAHKKQLDDIKHDAMINKMLQEQKDIIKSNKKKSPKSWDESVLVKGGISYYTVIIAGKKKQLRVSVTNQDNDVVLRYHIRNAEGNRVSVGAKTYMEAQQVINEIYGEGMYSVSGGVV